ncbi:MAG: acetate kinase [Alphaproteobacteria bacterium]
MKILVLNAGSSTLKYQLYNVENNEYNVIAKGNAERIGRSASFVGIKLANGDKKEVNVDLPNHNVAFNEVMKLLLDGVIGSLSEISAIGNRVVQGGDIFKKSTLVTEQVIKDIEELGTLAPLHNPAAVLVLRAVQKELPDVKQVVVFDTAFHQTMPVEAYTYALPEKQRKEYKIRRYGMHGTSHKYVSQEVAKIIGEGKKVITCHIGSGASITAVKNGECIDTSMGMTPLAGIVMDTRCGDIDPYVPLYMMKTQGLSVDEVNDIMNRQSGKAGLTGYSDSRDFEAAYNKGEPAVLDAMKCYIYSIAKQVGSYIAALEGLDAIVFTAGVGENSSLTRKLIMERLSYLGIKVNEEANSKRGEIIEVSTSDSKVRAFVIPTEEELMIARDTVELTA